MTRRTPDARSAAEKAFKAATTKPPPELPLPAKAPSLPGAKELVSLRVDRDVLDFFQQDGPGWQDASTRRYARRRESRNHAAGRRFRRGRRSQFRPIRAVCIKREPSGFLGIPVADEASYFSRFTLKFAEIMAAGIATAVSGYLIAHLGGFLSTTAPAPTPAAVEVAPRVVVVPQTVTVSPPAAADAGALRATPAREAAPQAAAPARTTANAAAAPARKRDTSAAEAKKPREKSKEAAEAKPREKEAAESKARDKDDKESVEARVRAALANVDASKPAPAEAPAPPRQAAIPPAPSAAAAQPLPAEAPLTTGAIAAAPRAAEAVPQPAPQAPAEPNPLLVEIKTRPVADVPPAAAAQTAPSKRARKRTPKRTRASSPPSRKSPASCAPAPAPPPANPRVRRCRSGSNKPQRP